MVDEKKTKKQLIHELRKLRKRVAGQSLNRGEDPGFNRVGSLDVSKLLDALPVCMSYVDSQERYCFNNKTYEQWWGLPVKEIRGKRIREVLGKDNYKKIRPHIKAVLNGETVSYETSVDLSGKGKKYLQAIHVPDLTPGGRVQGFYVLVSDITQRTLSQLQIAESQKLQQAILNSLSANVAVIDHTGTIIAVNEAWKRFASANGAPSLSKSGIGADYLDITRRAIEDGEATAVDALAGLQQVMSGTASNFALEYPCHSPKQKRWFQLHATQLIGSDHGVVVAHEDVTRRKMAQESLSHREQQYSTLVDCAPLCIQELDLKGKILTINPAGLAMLGLANQAQIRGRSCSNFVDPKDRKRFAAMMKRTSQGHLSQLEFACKINGVRRLVSATLVPCRDAAGSVTKLLGYVTDITAQRMAEQELLQSEAQLRVMTEQMPAILWTTDRELRFTVSMGAGLKDLNLSSGQAVGLTLYEYFQSADPALPPISGHQRALAGQSADYQMNWADRWYETRVEPLRNKGGKVVGCVGVAYDVTQQRRSADALRQSEVRLRLVLEQVPAILWTTDIDLRITSSLGSGLKALGYKPNQLVKQTLFERYSTTDLDDPRIAAHSQALRGRSAQAQVEAGDRLYQWWVEPLRDARRKVIGCIGLALDITQEKKIQQALQLSTAEVRRVSSRLESVREEERHRLSRWLHDELGQILVRMKMDLGFIAKQSNQISERRLRTALLKEIDSTNKLADTSISVVRQTAAELRSPMSDDRRLVPSIRTYAEQFQLRTGIECRVNQSPGRVLLGRTQSATVMRIVQEAMINTARHAKAKRVSVDIDLNGETQRLLLRVKDDGRGLSKKKSKQEDSLGIRGMRERAYLLAGELTISSKKGKGTTVFLNIPNRNFAHASQGEEDD